MCGFQNLIPTFGEVIVSMVPRWYFPHKDMPGLCCLSYGTILVFPENRVPLRDADDIPYHPLSVVLYTIHPKRLNSIQQMISPLLVIFTARVILNQCCLFPQEELSASSVSPTNFLLPRQYWRNYVLSFQHFHYIQCIVFNLLQLSTHESQHNVHDLYQQCFPPQLSPLLQQNVLKIEKQTSMETIQNNSTGQGTGKILNQNVFVCHEKHSFLIRLKPILPTENSKLSQKH